MIYRSSTLAFKKSELLAVLQAIDSDFSFEAIRNDDEYRSPSFEKVIQ